MRTIGNIVLPICSTDYIPAYGFGAKIPPHNNLSHCFALSGVPERYMVQGVDGLINAYKSSVANAQLHGPTIFSDVSDRFISNSCFRGWTCCKLEIESSDVCPVP
mmetsp:Transcript_30633/g.117151  ORF Transcript_30633/g.117151 Transcript_30633/m.117151 type:complete len:105 (-) Transcript_30633:3168-3482(-)